MFKITAMLKAFGINVTEENIRQVEILIPQIPGKAQEIVAAISITIVEVDKRLTALETVMKENNDLLREVIRLSHEQSQPTKLTVVKRK